MFSASHPHHHDRCHGEIAALVLSALMLASPVFASDTQPGNRWLISTINKDGIRSGVRISHQLMEKTPQWLPGTTSVPLSLDDALAAFYRWQLGREVKPDALSIEQLTMNEYGCPDHKGHWYYVLHYAKAESPASINAETRLDREFAVVLMDGTVVGTSVDQP